MADTRSRTRRAHVPLPQSGGGATGACPALPPRAPATPAGCALPSPAPLRPAFAVAGPAVGAALGAGIDATSERAPPAPTARTPAHSSSSCRLSEHDVTLPSGTTCSHVAAVVRRMSSSYDVAPADGCQLRVHACPPEFAALVLAFASWGIRP